MEYPTQSRRKTKHKIKPVFVLHIGNWCEGIGKSKGKLNNMNYLLVSTVRYCVQFLII